MSNLSAVLDRVRDGIQVTQMGQNHLAVTPSDPEVARSLVRGLRQAGVRFARQGGVVYVSPPTKGGKKRKKDSPASLAEDAVLAKIDQWRGHVRKYGGLSFRKASSGPLPPGTDPQQTAARLAQLTQKLAIAHKSPRLRRLSQILRQASVSRVRAARVLQALAAEKEHRDGPQLQRPTAAREAGETALRWAGAPDASGELVDAAKDYIHQHASLNQMRVDDLGKLNLDQIRSGWLRSLQYQGLDVPEDAVRAWEEATQGGSSYQADAKKEARRASPLHQGQDSPEVEYVSGEAGRWATQLVPHDSGHASDHFTIRRPRNAAEESKEQAMLLKIVERLIERTAPNKNPAEVTEEEVRDFTSNDYPTYAGPEKIEKIMKLLKKLTNRPERHPGDEDDDG
ncbi:MAG: hypothetical protein E6R03_00320, partial [Hyphomicrobiaceae bacterium]